MPPYAFGISTRRIGCGLQMPSQQLIPDLNVAKLFKDTAWKVQQGICAPGGTGKLPGLLAKPEPQFKLLSFTKRGHLFGEGTEVDLGLLLSEMRKVSS